MNYKDLNPSIRRGIKTIIEYWENLDKDIDINDDKDMYAGILQLLEDNYPDRFDFTCAVENLCDRFFKRFGYSRKKALIIKNKLMDLNYIDELNYDYVVKLLKEFDSVYCCLADLDQYPLTLVESLYAIAQLEKHEDMTQELQKDIWYIMSIYRGCPNFAVYKKLLNDYKYDYSENDFLSPDEREDIANSKFVEVYITDDELEFDPEIYGCCVKVRFPNGKTYKYNCRFDEIDENNTVFVTGKMKDIKGKVVERLEMWDTADYMEEISKIVYDEEGF